MGRFGKSARDSVSFFIQAPIVVQVSISGSFRMPEKPIAKLILPVTCVGI
jgi:hypothetical protein